MANVVKMTIQLRRDYAVNWEQYQDIVPAAGEPCFVIDKNILKIGDGETTFENLKPIGGDQFSITADGSSIILKDGAFKLAGFDEAAVGAMPRKNDEGQLEWVIQSTADVDQLKEDVENLQVGVADLMEVVNPSAEGSTPLLVRIDEIEGQIDSQESRLDTYDIKFDELELTIEDSVKKAVEAEVSTQIDEFANQVSDNGIVDTFKELINYVANSGGELQGLVADIRELQGLVGDSSVLEQIESVLTNGKYITENALLPLQETIEQIPEIYVSKKELETLQRVKFEIADTPVGTIVDYREKEIRVMCPAGVQFKKQSVGAGGDPNSNYMTFKTYAPSDDAVGYIERINGSPDEEILTNFSVDKYGRRYQPTWLAIAKYDDATDTWAYYGAKSTTDKYIGWDYQIDWYDANGKMIGSDCVRINLSNEDCHYNIEPYYMGKVVKNVSVNGTLLDMVDGKVDITIPEFKSSDEIEVAEDGTISIKQINFSKIAQAEEEEITLDGGGAAARS